MRLPATTALLGLAFVAGCTSSGGAAATTPPATTQSASTPPSSPGRTPVGLPVSTSTPIKRTLARPSGARPVDFDTCITPSNIVLLYLKKQIFEVADVDSQLIELPGAARLSAAEVRHITKARRVWLQDGYPAGFPIVRELDTYIEVYNKIIAAARAKNLDALPKLYLQLQKVNDQYLADARGNVCQA